jgi:CBS domain-containing protein
MEWIEMFVEQILPQARERLAVVDVGAVVKDAADLMAKPHVDLVVVCNDGAAVGVVTKTDIVAHVSRQLASRFDAPVATIMARDAACCRATDPLLDVWQVMKERGFQRIPVVDERRNPLGVVYLRDVLQGLLKEVEIEDELLRDYIFGVGYQ